MTLPDERFRAVMNTRMFLHELCNPQKTPKVPRKVREDALWCLRHYPSAWEMKQVAEASPHIFQEQMEEVERMFIKYEQSKVEKNET